MTLREWLDEYTRDGDAQYVCSWRKRAWRAMRPVVAKFVEDREAGIERPAGELIIAIRQARAEARIAESGKRWKKEYQLLVEAIQEHPELWPAPTADEAGVCEVARDLMLLERFEEVRELLVQAPNRFNRKCPACGSKPGIPCSDLNHPLMHVVVPHEARLVA
jgi:hypothetical protein